jgi:hypothetical protein
MTKRFYPIEEKKEKDDSNRQHTARQQRANNRTYAILSVSVFLFFAISAVICLINWKEYSIQCIVFTLLALFPGGLSILSLKEYKKQNYDVTLRTDEMLVLYDDYLEYHYTEEDKDCIVSAKYKNIYADCEDYDVCGVYCSGSNIILKHKKHNDYYADYVIDEAQQLKSITIPSYFFGDNDLVKILADKTH